MQFKYLNKISIVLIFTVVFTPSKIFPQSVKAIEVMNNAIKAMGGEELLNSISTMRLQGKKIEYLIDQSIRPGGPYLVNHYKFESKKIIGQNKMAYWLTYVQSGFAMRFTLDGDVIGAKQGKAYFPFLSEIDEEFYLAPEKVLLMAKNSSTVYTGDTVIQHIPHHILVFKWRNYPVRLIFNKNSGYLSFVEITRHYADNTPFLLGDVKRVHQYSLWKMIDKKFHYPLQKDVYLDGQHYQSMSYDSVVVNIPLAPDSLTIADSAKIKLTGMAKMMDVFGTVPTLTSKEVAPGLFYIKGKGTALGNYNSWFIKTAQGIVIIEAPVSSAYSKAVLNEVRKQFPNEKIRTIITCSDAWPHVGGLREYVANKIPIHLLSLNSDLVERLIDADYITNPDSLQRKRQKPILNKVSKKLVLTDKENPIEIYPIASETGERMMMVYLPKSKILYTADLVQPGQSEKFFMRQYIYEIVEAINREGLQADKIIGIHQPIINYQELLDFMK